MIQFKAHVMKILNEGTTRPSRNDGGEDSPDSSISIIGPQLRFDLNEGFPLVTSKKVAIKTMAKEITWMLRGNINTKSLDSDIWDLWSLKDDVNVKKELEQSEIVDLVLNRNPDLTIEEFLDGIFQATVEGAIINEGAMFDYANNIPLTKEHLTKENIYTYVTAFEKEPLLKYLESKGVNREELSKIVYKFSKGYCGPIYGYQWRNFTSTYFDLNELKFCEESADQFKRALAMLRHDLYTRRAVISAWNPVVLPDPDKTVTENIISGNMGLPPCHYSFQLLVSYNKVRERDEMNLILNLRSSDTMVGLPFNIAAYAFICHLFALELNVNVGELIVNIGDAHIYKSHIEGAKSYLAQPLFKLPKYTLTKEQYETLKEDLVIQKYLDDHNFEDVEVEKVDEQIKKQLDFLNENPAIYFEAFLNALNYNVFTDYLEGYKFAKEIKFDLHK